MEVYEYFAQIAMGFIPTIVAMEITYKVSREFEIVGRNEIAAISKMMEGAVMK